MFYFNHQIDMSLLLGRVHFHLMSMNRNEIPTDVSILGEQLHVKLGSVVTTSASVLMALETLFYVNLMYYEDSGLLGCDAIFMG